MPLWLAVTLLLLSLGGIALARKSLRGNRALRIACVSVCALLALCCAAYIGLTLLFVDAVSSQSPAL